MKTEIGYDYKWVINDARYIVNRMKETNLQEAIQTEHGIQLVDTFRDQAFIESTQFSNYIYPISK